MYKWHFQKHMNTQRIVIIGGIIVAIVLIIYAATRQPQTEPLQDETETPAAQDQGTQPTSPDETSDATANGTTTIETDTNESLDALDTELENTDLAGNDAELNEMSAE